MRTTHHETVITIDTPVAPPHWALLERELIRAQAEAIEEYYAHYFDARGYLLCVPRWGGDDGPDDAAENLLNWTLLTALGAPARLTGTYAERGESMILNMKLSGPNMPVEELEGLLPAMAIVLPAGASLRGGYLAFTGKGGLSV